MVLKMLHKPAQHVLTMHLFLAPHGPKAVIVVSWNQIGSADVLVLSARVTVLLAACGGRWAGTDCITAAARQRHA